jgi:hypothetical protein
LRVSCAQHKPAFDAASTSGILGASEEGAMRIARIESTIVEVPLRGEGDEAGRPLATIDPNALARHRRR